MKYSYGIDYGNNKQYIPYNYVNNSVIDRSIEDMINNFLSNNPNARLWITDSTGKTFEPKGSVKIKTIEWDSLYTGSGI